MKKGIKNIIILILLGTSCFISWSLYFRVYVQKDTVNIHQFPQEIGGWSSEEMIITEKEYDILETRNAFSRRYTTSSDQEVYLFVVYSQNNRKVSHPPEICYTGSGVSVVSNTHDTISAQGEKVLLNKLTLEYGHTRQIAFYWFKVGDSFTSNYWKQQALIVLKNLLGQPASSALIRISATVKDFDSAKTEDTIKEFCRDMIPHLQKYLP